MFPKEKKYRHLPEPLRSPEGGPVKRVGSVLAVRFSRCRSTENRLTRFDQAGEGAAIREPCRTFPRDNQQNRISSKTGKSKSGAANAMYCHFLNRFL